MRLGRPTENVVIKDCTLFSSIFAGLGIGSEMSGGIRDVRVEDCLIFGWQTGSPSRAGGGTRRFHREHHREQHHFEQRPHVSRH